MAGKAASYGTVGAAGGSFLGPLGTVVGGAGGALLGGLVDLFGGGDDEEAKARAEALARQEGIANQMQSESGFMSQDPSTNAYLSNAYGYAASKDGRASGQRGWTPYLQDRSDLQDAFKEQHGGLQNYQYALDQSRRDMQNAGKVGSLSDVLAKRGVEAGRNQAAGMAAQARGGGASSALAQWQAGQMAASAANQGAFNRMQGAFQEKQAAANLYTQAMHGNQNALNAIQQGRIHAGNQSLGAQEADDRAALAAYQRADQQMDFDRQMRAQAAANAANIRSGSVLADTAQGNLDRAYDTQQSDRDMTMFSTITKGNTERSAANGAYGGNAGGGSISGGGGGGGTVSGQTSSTTDQGIDDGTLKQVW